MRTTIYTARDIRRVVEHVGLDNLMDAMIKDLWDTLLGHTPHSFNTPARATLEYSTPNTGLIEWMPALLPQSPAVVKMVGYHPSNPVNFDLPTILASTLQFDTANGRLMSLLDSSFLTALRTGAASAIASRVLARKGSRVVGLIGAGAQAVTQLHALSRVLELEQALVYDLNPATLDSFSQRVSYCDLPGIDIRPAAMDELCREADVICTATSVTVGGGPVMLDSNLKPWLHVNAVGSDFPGKTELPESLLQRSLVCPDHLEQALREGECQQLSASHIGPTLHQLVTARDDYRAHRDSSTVFDSTGWALEDHVAFNTFQRFAMELECGTELELADLSSDPHSPYAIAGECTGAPARKNTVTETIAGTGGPAGTQRR